MDQKAKHKKINTNIRNNHIQLGYREIFLNYDSKVRSGIRILIRFSVWHHTYATSFCSSHHSAFASLKTSLLLPQELIVERLVPAVLEMSLDHVLAYIDSKMSAVVF